MTVLWWVVRFAVGGLVGYGVLRALFAGYD